MKAHRNSNKLVEVALTDALKKVGEELDADILSYSGPISYQTDSLFRDGIEEMQKKSKKLAVILETDGGFINVVERIVNVLRHHYETVDFIIPDHAMSAGTVLALSGDSIYMNYYSVLGPIDPQIRMSTPNKEGFVPALGYLEQFNRLIEKSASGDLTTAELYFLTEKFDPAELYEFEQARELTIALLEKWLAKYKFKNWKVTETQQMPVTEEYRIERAREIARQLNNTQLWHSHGRCIPMEVLRNDLRLQIEDFGKHQQLEEAIKTYHATANDYMHRRGHDFSFHTEKSYRGG